MASGAALDGPLGEFSQAPLDHRVVVARGAELKTLNQVDAEGLEQRERLGVLDELGDGGLSIAVPVASGDAGTQRAAQ